MSIRVMTMVWEHSKHTGNALLLLLAIADFADDNGVAFPSVNRLARKSRMSERNTHYTIATLENSGELDIQRGHGRAGTNLYQIKVNPSSALFNDTPSRTRRGAKLAGGAKPAPGAKDGEGGATPGAEGGATATAPEPSLTVKRTTKVRAGQEPSPVARCFKAYQDGIRAKYGTTFPPNAKANGQLAQVVARVGAEQAEAVVRAYLASQNPYYGKIKHRLDALVKDCEQLFMDLQRTTGQAAPEAPTTAQIALLAPDGRVVKRLDDRPAGDMSRIALQALKEHMVLIGRMETTPKYVAVRQGMERRQYSIEELQEAARAHA